VEAGASRCHLCHLLDRTSPASQRPVGSCLRHREMTLHVGGERESFQSSSHSFPFFLLDLGSCSQLA